MRHHLDYYKTPTFAVDTLLKHVSLNSQHIIECCSGNGEISDILKTEGFRVTTNDLDDHKPADYHFRADDPRKWPDEQFDFVITNPPFSSAYSIITTAYGKARLGMAMLLRLSFLEPTFDRQEWLGKNPPNLLLVLPRISFTGDGKTDSVTVAWMVWNKLDTTQRIIITGKSKG